MFYSNSRNCSTERPASRAIPPIVERIDRIVAGNSHYTLAVAHHDVLPLTHDPKTGFFKSANGVEMIDAGDLGRG